MTLPRPARSSAAAPTLSGTVLEGLRRDILEGRWAPGAKLRFEALRERYRVGLSPLREALSRLTVEGLVVGIDRRGFCVAPVSLADLDDITALRCELEAVALRWAIAHGDDVWEASVVAAAHQLTRMHWEERERPHQISDEWERRHTAFHEALTAACGSPRLMQLRAQFFNQTNRYRRLAVAFSHTVRDDRGEHATLVEAALARNADKAADLIRKHIMRTAEDVRAIYAAGGDVGARAPRRAAPKRTPASRGR
ncbi:MAG: FCD domain-containing protein [Rhodospirillaceae bacterium]|nr:FCD domain-containing protein [Rhodospirillaceae bacterium]